MHSFSEVIAALNDVRDRGVVRAYAIAGAMAVTFWSEPVATFDVDVLVLLGEGERTVITLEPIYRWARARGYEVRAEHVVIADVPVQFLPAYNALAEEAIRNAKILDYGGVPVSVVTREYLIGLALDPPAKTARRKERAAMLAESPTLDRAILDDIMARYNLSW
ncbi:MAG: hypothetical protein HY655_01740 [Acidobacteria bacterium]|nr:hypothetical protein [Acidobacteriota bacterium]